MKNENEIIRFVTDSFPAIDDEIDSDDGVYVVLGELAIYLGKGIENNCIDESTIEIAVRFMNEQANDHDAEVRNMLVVGIFETLSNYEISANRIKRDLCPEAINLYDKYFS